MRGPASLGSSGSIGWTGDVRTKTRSPMMISSLSIRSIRFPQAFDQPDHRNRRQQHGPENPLGDVVAVEVVGVVGHSIHSITHLACVVDAAAAAAGVGLG